MNQQPTPNDDRQQHIRQLGHDVRSNLHVINMGLETLKGARNDADMFAEIVTAIRHDGIQPIQAHLEALIELALECEKHD